MKAWTLSRTTEARPSLIELFNANVRKVPNWVLYGAAAGYALWLFYLGATGGLGVEPVEALEHAYGKFALQMIVLGLAITPLCKHAHLKVVKFRRPIGVIAFFFVLAHVLVWAVLDVQSVERILADIAKRPYITIGMVAFVLLIPLAITSNDLSVRKLGALVWRKIHKAVYAAAILSALHYVWLAKGFQLEPLIYTGLIVGLIALRYVPTTRRSKGLP